MQLRAAGDARRKRRHDQREDCSQGEPAGLRPCTRRGTIRGRAKTVVYTMRRVDRGGILPPQARAKQGTQCAVRADDFLRTVRLTCCAGVQNALKFGIGAREMPQGLRPDLRHAACAWPLGA